MRLEARSLDTSTEVARRVGNADLAVAALGDASITREVMHPGWRWSTDVKPVVGTDLCRASHQFFIASGRLHVVMEDDAEIELEAGDAGIIPPGHDAWVDGDAPCEMIDFSPTYGQLIEAGQAYQAMTAPGQARASCSRGQAAEKLRAEARLGRLDTGAAPAPVSARYSMARRSANLLSMLTSVKPLDPGSGDQDAVERVGMVRR